MVSGKYARDESPAPREMCSRLLHRGVDVFPVWSEAKDVDDIFARSSGDESVTDLAVDLPPLLAAHTARALDAAIVVPTSRFVLTPFKDREETASYAAVGQVDAQGAPIPMRPARLRAEAKFNVPDGSKRLFVVVTEATWPARPFGMRVTLAREDELPRDMVADPAFTTTVAPGTVAAAFDVEPGQWTLQIRQPESAPLLSYVEGSLFVGVEGAPGLLGAKMGIGPFATSEVAITARLHEPLYALDTVRADLLAPGETRWRTISATPDKSPAGDRFLANIGRTDVAGTYKVAVVATYVSRNPEQTLVDRFEVSEFVQTVGAPMLLAPQRFPN